MRKYLVAFFFLLIITAQAQVFTVAGKVTDASDKLPLPGVIVVIATKSAITDSLGSYKITLPVRPTKVIFKLLGYETQTRVFEMVGVDIIMNVSLSTGNSNLNEVVVTGSKFEQKIAEVITSIDVLKPRLIESSGNTNMETAVEQVSGVNVVKGQVNIRGGSGFSYGAGSRVLVLVDDLPILSPDAGDVKWNYLPTENLQQVEVIKGAASSLFGSSALGGVINLRTTYPKENPETKVRVFTGMFDDYAKSYYNYNSSPILNHGIFASHSRKIGHHDLVCSGALVLDNQYRQDETTKFGRFTANYKYHFKKVEGLMAGVNTNFYRQRSNVFLMWKNDSNPSIPYDGTLSRQFNNRFNIDPFITYTSPNGHKHAFRNRYYYNDNKGIDDQKNNYKAELIYDEYQYQKSFGDTSGNELKFILGAANTYSRIKSDSVYGNKTSDNVAGYMQAEYKLKNILFSLGVRAEHFKVDTLQQRFIKVLRAGLNWHIFKATYLRASIGEGYRMPSVAELYASTSSGSLKIFPNPNLQPESGWGTEIGLKQGFMLGDLKGMVDLAAFQTKYQNMIEFIFGYYPPDPNFMGNPLPYIGFAARNYTNAKISGIEATMAAEGKIGQVAILLTGGYTYINPLNLDSLNAVVSKNKYLKYRNNHLFRFNADADYKGFSIGASVRYSSFMTNIDDAFNILLPGVKSYREQHSKGDWITDIRVSYKIKKFNSAFSLIIKNVTNHEYMFAPANLGAPRYFMLQYNVIL